MNIEQQLRDAGFKVTNARVAVLSFLESQNKPIGIERIAEHYPEINLATLYRMMNDFAQAEIVQAHQLGHGHQDYELTNRPHHHHIVCEICGEIEDVYACGNVCEFKQKALVSSKKFKHITKQTTTFFGICKSCS
jgi:Fur family transcriptional regulator, ferric uptake regulator